jgi:hypothetical protein
MKQILKKLYSAKVEKKYMYNIEKKCLGRPKGIWENR